MGTGLHLALFNPIDPALPMAERELALRLAEAVGRLGWTTAIRHRAADIDSLNPDAVLCLHPQATPKLTRHPWLGCYWNPPALQEGNPGPSRLHGQAFELTHDAYLVSGPILAAHLAGLMAGVGRDPPTLPFHVSSPRSDLAPNLGPHSRLFYVGSNWDGRRYPSLLRRLAEAGALALYGTAERWSHLPEAWQGPLPFDGRSVIEAAHRQGMGLCLHLPQHRGDGVPNMRVFELAAAGAVIIADRHPFIQEWFGDTVLYVDLEGGEEAGAAEILERFAWIQAHPAQATAMAVAAQEIFNRHLCLEALLSPLPDLLADLARRRPGPTSVAVLLPGGDDLAGRLAQLRDQTEDGLSVTALIPAGTGPRPTGQTGAGGVHIQIVPEQAGLPALCATLGEAQGETTMLAILPEGVEWHPGHLAGLAAATGREGATLAAGLWPRGPEDQGFPIDPAEDRALPSPDPVPVLGGRELERAWLRAGGLGCGVQRLRDFQSGDGLAARGDWMDLALALAPALAADGGLKRLTVPSLRLVRPPIHDGVRMERLPPWPCTALADRADRPPRLTGLNDLNPDRAANIPFLWHPADFGRLPAVGPIWLYGAGLGGELVLDGLPDAARARLRGFLDSRRQGSLRDLPLLRPQDVDPGEMATATIIIAAQYVSDILRGLGQGTAPAHILNAYPYIAARQEEIATQPAQQGGTA